MDNGVQDGETPSPLNPPTSAAPSKATSGDQDNNLMTIDDSDNCELADAQDLNSGVDHRSGRASKQKCSALNFTSILSRSLATSSASASALGASKSVSTTSASKKPTLSRPRDHKCNSKLSAATLAGQPADASQPVMLQAIQSQFTRMNNLFEKTSEDPDANLQRLETHLNPEECAHFYDLFSTAYESAME